MKFIDALPLLFDGTISELRKGGGGGQLACKVVDGNLTFKLGTKECDVQNINVRDMEADWTPVHMAKKVETFEVGDTVKLRVKHFSTSGTIEAERTVKGVFYYHDKDLKTRLYSLHGDGRNLYSADSLERLAPKPRKTKVISAFPGTGKTTFAKTIPNTLDLDSGEFKKAHGEYDFFNKYQKAIIDAMGKYDYILVSTHPEVRALLAVGDIPFTLVYPSKGLKETYMNRYMGRGDNEKFIGLMGRSFMKFSEDLDHEPDCKKRIVLREKDASLLSIKNLLDEELI